MTTPAGDAMSLSASQAFSLPHSNLPDEPLVILQPTSAWSIFDFKELWAHRELLYFLVWRDIKIRYKQTILGVAWVILQPVVMTIIFTVFLGMLVRVPTGGIPYPLMVFTGLVPWTFFSTSLLGASQSMVANAPLITKVYFPRVLIPAATMVARLVDFFISFVLLALLILYFAIAHNYQFVLTWNLLLFPVLVILLILLTLGLSILVAAVNVKYRDVGIALPVLIQLWMFVSPIVYSARLVPERWRAVYSLNPLVGLIEGFRASLLGGPIPRFGIIMTATIAVLLLICASILFCRTERTLADIV